jgi:hypothetical protein
MFDPSFHTCKQDEFDLKWQLKARFVAQREPEPKNAAKAQVQVLQSAKSKTASDNQATESPPKQQRREADRSELNNQLQHHDLEIPSQQPEPPEEPFRNEDKGSSVPTNNQTLARKSQPIERLIEAVVAEVKAASGESEGEMFCLTATCPVRDKDDNPSLAHKALADPDAMHMHEAMKEPDRKEIIKAMQKEVSDQSNNKNFSTTCRSEVPEGATTLPTAWQMKWKPDIKTQEIKKWKARLNVDGSRMQKGKHCWETYAPAASWQSLRLLLTMSALHNWHTAQLDFVLAFPQAPVEKDLCMDVPKGFDTSERNRKDCASKIHQSVCGQKQAGRVWNQRLVDKLVGELKFVQSRHDECVFCRGTTMHASHVDDSTLTGPDKAETDQTIKEMQEAKLDVTVEGNLQELLGANIERKADSTVHLTQPHLIDQILKDLRLEDKNVTTMSMPASSSKLLSRHSDSEAFDGSFDHRSAIGKCNCLEKSTRSNIACVAHQCARFSADPKKEHGKASRWLGCCSKATRDEGTMLKPNGDKDMEAFVDADFSGNWDGAESHNQDTTRSRHGCITMHAGCPVSWKSQLQTEIALSSTESEHAGLSHALRDAIQTMELLKEMKKLGFPIRSTVPKMHCKVFEDNSGALEMATTHKCRLRTKHLNVKLHRFRDCVTRKEMSTHPIDTSNQLADHLTKAVNQQTMEKLRCEVMGS